MLIMRDRNRLAKTDALTGLYNRYGLSEEMNRIYDRKELPLLFAIMDIDNFKSVNDTLGHAGGDEALKLLADTMRLVFGTHVLMARFGGDEFMVVCVWPKKTAPKGFEKPFKKQFEALLRRRQERTMKDYPIGVSIGCVSREIVTVSEVDEMMREADDSMYRIKENHHHVRLARRD